MFQFLLKRDSAFPAILLLLISSIGLAMFPTPAMKLTTESGPLALLMAQHLHQDWLMKCIWVAALIFQAWQFHRLHLIQGLSEDKDSLFFFSYCAMALIAPAMRVTSDVFLAQTFLLWALIDLKAVYSHSKAGHSFNMGLKMAIAFLFYKPVIFVFPALQLCMLIAGAMSFRLFIVGWLGFASPLYLAGGTLYLFNELDAFMAVTARISSGSYRMELPDKRMWFPISVAYGVSLVLAMWFRSQRRIEVQFQIYNQLHWALIALLAVLVFTVPSQGNRVLIFCLIPLAYFNARLLRQLGKQWAFESAAILQLALPFVLAFILAL